MPIFSDFIVYADESGDHGMASINPYFPIFALNFCVVRKEDYADKVVSKMKRFKFGVWGHDSIILHENDIRKNRGPFRILRTDPNLRKKFYDELNSLIETMPIKIFASVIDKQRKHEKLSDSRNPYEIALYLCMEQLHKMLLEEKQHGKQIHIVFESRGHKEDAELELEFRRIANNGRRMGSSHPDFNIFDFMPVFVPKAANSTGLQLADLMARPIALSRLRENQPNRAYDIIQKKIVNISYFP